VTLPAATRIRQFPDRPEWQDHIDQHSENLGGSKVPMCPHPRGQCADAFKSAQELKFHLQDVHCVELRKGCKRSSPESEVDTRPRKIKSPVYANPHEACVKQEYKFVDKAANLWSRETSRKPTASSISSKGSTPTPDWDADLAQSRSYTPPSSTCSDELDKIDPILLAGSTLPSIGPSTYDATEVVDLTNLDSETTHPIDSIVSPNERRDSSIGDSRIKQDPEHPPVASVRGIYDEPIDAELEDGQFLVERLLGKRVRRVRRRKAVQYLVRWKGYTEEENTWEDVQELRRLRFESVNLE
jgi:hypothetical protein